MLRLLVEKRKIGIFGDFSTFLSPFPKNGDLEVVQMRVQGLRLSLQRFDGLFSATQGQLAQTY